MKKWQSVLCFALCLVLPLSAIAEPVQPDRAASLTLRLTEEGSGLPGATFTVYRVAAMDDDARFALLAGYDVGSVDINKVEGAAAWSALAETLAAQVGVSTATAATNQQGKALFPDMKSGLYLVIGQPVEIGYWVYDFAPFMVSVPGKNEDGWQYDTVAEVKHQRSPQTFDLQVVKAWKDRGFATERPQRITVGLYCNGILTDTAELNAKNNWTHTFTGLETIHRWTVQEQTVPAGYQVAYAEQDGAWVITNTFTDKPPVDQVIPQTGLMWWPVPLMAVLGVTLVIIGLALRRKWSNEHDEG